jgi:hypothetical protein
MSGLLIDDVHHAAAPSQANWSCTKSKDQRAFGLDSTEIGAFVPRSSPRSALANRQPFLR